MTYTVEICIDNIESAIDAQNAGADRVEVCTNLAEGGATPGYGTIAAVREGLTIGVHVIIRPRGGDFLYTNREYDVMRRDIEMCGECGADGIVVGLLRADGTVDVERTSRLIEAARPMSATFHRAFDLCPDPLQGFEDVIACGANRLLTSGQQNKAASGAALIRELVHRSRDRIIVMPGSGIDESNIALLAAATEAHEFHLTGRSLRESGMLYRKKGVPLGGGLAGDDFARLAADPVKLKKIISILAAL